MPLYEYVCRECNLRSELLVRSAGEKAVCPGCGSRRMVRQISVFAAHTAGGQGPSCPAAETCPQAACPGRSSCPLA